MPKSSGFMQGLNLNLGTEKERKASLIAGLALNPSLLSRAVLAGGICGHRAWRRPAVGSTGWRGGLGQESKGGISNPQIPTGRLCREPVGCG